MTREEAIRVCLEVLGPHFADVEHMTAERLVAVAEMEVDMFSRLGMLTLSPQGSEEANG